MKLEDAVDILKGYKQRLDNSCSNQLDKDKDAFDLAIKALETGEVYMTAEDYNVFMMGYKDGMKDYRSIVEENERLKAEQRPKGNWVRKEKGISMYHYVCSNCGYESVSGKPNFCQRCGSDMRGDTDDNRDT